MSAESLAASLCIVETMEGCHVKICLLYRDSDWGEVHDYVEWAENQAPPESWQAQLPSQPLGRDFLRTAKQASICAQSRPQNHEQIKWLVFALGLFVQRWMKARQSSYVESCKLSNTAISLNLRNYKLNSSIFQFKFNLDSFLFPVSTYSYKYRI